VILDSRIIASCKYGGSIRFRSIVTVNTGSPPYAYPSLPGCTHVGLGGYSGCMPHETEITRNDDGVRVSIEHPDGSHTYISAPSLDCRVLAYIVAANTGAGTEELWAPSTAGTLRSPSLPG
jgi:hypothetical protein